jgi:hypothetical protein
LKTEIKNLEERVNRLNETQAASLTKEEANHARAIWINLHWTQEEADEYANIHKRLDVLLENAKARSYQRIPGEQAESSRLSARATELAHDIGMKRALGNHAMRDHIWPELVPRVLRLRKLTEKPEDALPEAEMRELNDLTKWFMDLRIKAVESAEKQLAQTSKQKET